MAPYIHATADVLIPRRLAREPKSGIKARYARV